MEVAAVITVCKRFRAVKLSALVAIVAFVHIAEARYEFKTFFQFSELADAAFGIGVVELVF